MIEISLTQALAVYSAVLGLTIGAIWLYTELSIRRPQRLLGEQFLWRCSFCGCTYLDEAAQKGIKVFIAAAGLSAALPGVVASHTIQPVIGVPVPAGALKGVDALLSIVQMPGGIPVATVGIGSNGPKNAALLAAAMLSLGDEQLQARLKEYRKKLSEG